MTKRGDVTGLPNLLTTTGRVAPVRSRQLIYLDVLPPYNAGYPAGENIQEWLRLIKAGQHKVAWRQLTADNPLPTVHSRVCCHPYETACSRKDLDAAVSIYSAEHYLGDLALERGWRFGTPSRDSRWRVLIIGAGPSGLSAAYRPRRLGHEVGIYGSADTPGSMTRYGIPRYRLPRDILDAEVARITDIGVVIRDNTPVTDLPATQVADRFDAVFVAIGAYLSKCVDIPSANATKIVDAVSFLRDVAKGGGPAVGRRVAVYGGGSTTMDTTRAARRLGAEGSVIVYRRTVEQMPTHTEECENAKQEGVRMDWLRTITEMGEEDLTIEIIELDEEGRIHGTERFKKLAADTVILAVGQEADTGFLHAVPGMIFDRGVVQVDPNTLMTSVPGIFAGDDTMPSECTVTVGVEHGKEAARCIDKWLSPDVAPRDPKYLLIHFDQMNLWYFGGHTRRVQAEQAPEMRMSDFGEIVAGLNPKEAEFEARRCLSCGNCFECDGYYGAYPEDAVIELGPGSRYRSDYKHCTGCAAYYGQCPVYAIETIPEGRQ